ncbi:zinc-binding dehydrogenase [Terrabacter sp. MAHUQ-38]|uniref:zinc-binding dehydrogenase n=1 Tax=unclassified Terrabacter TaxID=2630222 RepID=UPI001CAA7A4C
MPQPTSRPPAAQPREVHPPLKAFIVNQYGKDSVPRVGGLPTPEIGERDVLVRIHAAGVNPLDNKIVDSGALKPVVDRAFDFDEASGALDYVRTGRAEGKVVLTMT